MLLVAQLTNKEGLSRFSSQRQTWLQQLWDDEAKDPEGSEEGCCRLNNPEIQKTLQLAQSSGRQNPLEAAFWGIGTEEMWPILKDNLLNLEQSWCARKHANVGGGQLGWTRNCWRSSNTKGSVQDVEAGSGDQGGTQKYYLGTQG